MNEPSNQRAADAVANTLEWIISIGEACWSFMTVAGDLFGGLIP